MNKADVTCSAYMLHRVWNTLPQKASYMVIFEG